MGQTHPPYGARHEQRWRWPWREDADAAAELFCAAPVRRAHVGHAGGCRKLERCDKADHRWMPLTKPASVGESPTPRACMSQRKMRRRRSSCSPLFPDQDHLEVDAVLENRDVGFVVVGQPGELKIDAYPFTRYGLAKGTVLSVDRDAEATPVNQAAQGSLRAADEIDNVEWSERLRYTVHIALVGQGGDSDREAADHRIPARAAG
jgi:hypothetical protein